MIGRLREILAQNEVDAFVLTSYENRRYASGFTGSSGIAVVTPDKALLYVDGRYTIQAGQEAQGFTVVESPAAPFPLLAELSLTHVYLEDETLPLITYQRIKDALFNANFHNGSMILSGLRAVKTPKEQENIAQAAQIADLAFSHILHFIRPGVREREIALELEFFMRKNGAEGVAFDTIAAAGARSALPHAQPTDRQLQKGDILLLDYGCKFKGYCSDMTRTVVLGKASDLQKEVYRTVLAAQEAALSVLRSGVSGKAADAAARGVIEDAGYGPKFVHSLGHGVGLQIHEQPTLSPRSEGLLPAGCAVTVEPGIYLQDAFGVRIEDLVIVTADGIRNLCRSPKALIEL